MKNHPLALALGLNPNKDIEFNEPLPCQIEFETLDMSGSMNPHYGMKHSDKAKKLMSKKKKGKMQMKDAATGKSVGLHPKTHPNYVSGVWVHINKGAKRSMKDREARSKAYKAKGHRPTTTHKDTYWWTNGIECKRLENSPGDGWRRGRK